MNTVQNTSLLDPAARPWPRMSRAMRTALARAGRAVWRALEAHGRTRGRRELLALADRWEIHQPELARELRLASRRAS